MISFYKFLETQSDKWFQYYNPIHTNYVKIADILEAFQKGTVKDLEKAKKLLYGASESADIIYGHSVNTPKDVDQLMSQWGSMVGDTNILAMANKTYYAADALMKLIKIVESQQAMFADMMKKKSVTDASSGYVQTFDHEAQNVGESNYGRLIASLQQKSKQLFAEGEKWRRLTQGLDQKLNKYHPNNFKLN